MVARHVDEPARASRGSPTGLHSGGFIAHLRADECVNGTQRNTPGTLNQMTDMTDQGRPHHLMPRAVAQRSVTQGPVRFGDARNLLVLEVETKGGIVGMGYLFSFRPGLKTIVAALEETSLPHVIGKDATAVEGIWTDLWKRTVTYNRGGIVTMAMSALDIALWDAIGKRANMPLHRQRGPCALAAAGLWLGCFRGSGGDGMIAKALHYKQQGYKAIKMQMAHTTDLRGDVDQREARCARRSGPTSRS